MEEQEYRFGAPQEPAQESADKARISLHRILASVDCLTVRETTRMLNLIRLTLSERIALAEGDILRHRDFGRLAKLRETEGYRLFYVSLERFANEILALHRAGWAVERFHLAAIFRAMGDVLAGLTTPDAAAAKFVAMHMPATVVSGTTLSDALTPKTAGDAAAFVEQGAKAIAAGKVEDGSGGWEVDTSHTDGAPSSAAEA